MEHITNEQLNEKIDKHIEQHTKDFEIINQRLDGIKGIWWKIALAVALPFIGYVYGYGVLSNKVENEDHAIQKLQEEKANKETLDTQLVSINSALVEIKLTLKELSRPK